MPPITREAFEKGTGMLNISVHGLGRGVEDQEEPPARQPRRGALEDGRGAPACLRRARRRDVTLIRGTSGFILTLSLEAETSGPVCTDPSKLPNCQRAAGAHVHGPHAPTQGIKAYDL